MKRYEALLADMESAGYLTPAADGGWMRYEDHAAEVARLTAALEAAPRFTQFNCAEEFMAGSREELEARAEALQARVAELEAEVAIAWDDDAETKRANAAESELADLRGRVERALESLDETGNLEGLIKLRQELRRGR